MLNYSYMERTESPYPNADRFFFDEYLTKLGYVTLWSALDYSQHGAWLHSGSLKLCEFAGASMAVTDFEDSQELIGFLEESQPYKEYTTLDDHEQNWSVPIVRSELEIYLSYARDDAIEL